MEVSYQHSKEDCLFVTLSGSKIKGVVSLCKDLNPVRCCCVLLMTIPDTLYSTVVGIERNPSLQQVLVVSVFNNCHNKLFTDDTLNGTGSNICETFPQ